MASTSSPRAWEAGSTSACEPAAARPVDKRQITLSQSTYVRHSKAVLPADLRQKHAATLAQHILRVCRRHGRYRASGVPSVAELENSLRVPAVYLLKISRTQDPAFE